MAVGRCSDVQPLSLATELDYHLIASRASSTLSIRQQVRPVEDTMKTYKVMRTYTPVGKAGDKVSLSENKFTEQLLNQGIVAELKVIDPEETKAPKRKPRTKKAD